VLGHCHHPGQRVLHHESQPVGRRGEAGLGSVWDGRQIEVSPNRIIDEKPRNGDSVIREVVEDNIDIEDTKIGDDIKK
jgi:hypothetical protein